MSRDRAETERGSSLASEASPFSPTGVAMQVNRTLRHIELGSCGIKQSGADLIKTTLSQQKGITLEHIGLFGNADEIIDDLPEVYGVLTSNASAGEARRAEANEQDR